ncbi:MAG: N-acetyltransferase [Clostridia bacterium]|nr:N-acetyltransferase [Clostridia bacterium]
MPIRKAVLEDLPALLDIYNHEVLNGTATFDLTPQTLPQRRMWFDAHNTENHPLFVYDADGVVAGYVSLSDYREKEAYRSTVELSVYVHPAHRGKGLATELMGFILDEARRDDSIHTVVSVITSGNTASVRLHEKFGFTFGGTIKEVGKKFGEYLDIDNYYLSV